MTSTGDADRDRIDGDLVQQRLDRAVEDGRLLVDADGRYRLPPDPSAGSPTSDTPSIHRPGDLLPDCNFLNGFLFQIAYDRKQPPHGCRACFKLLIFPGSLRGLMTLKGLLDATPYTSKVRNEALDPNTPNSYVGVVYFDGLENARRGLAELQPRIDASPDLGSSVAMEIRRGCSNYERACGPSDQYRFGPEQERIERDLERRFNPANPSPYSRTQRNSAAMLRLVRIAFQLGDETYKDFSNGRALSAALVRYDAPKSETDA